MNKISQLTVMCLLLAASRVIADTNSLIDAVFSNVTAYLTVDLVKTNPGEDIYRRLPVPFPQSISGDFTMAGQYLFRKDRVQSATTPFPTNEFLSLIKSYDPNMQWPVLRCPPNKVLALVLQDPRGMINGIILLDVCNDAITVEDAKGQGAYFRFGSGNTHMSPLIGIVAPELKY